MELTTLEIILIAVLWLVLGVILAEKQKKAQDHMVDESIKAMIVIFAPLVLIGAIIRQTFFEKWR